MNLRSIYYSLSPKSRFLVRKIYYYPVDIVDNILGKKNKYVPNKGDIFIGSGNFLAQGKHHLELLNKYADLKEDHSVLDIGCGIGRAAVALTQYLSVEAKYEGFDVVEKGIIWCKKHITNDYPNFNFRYIPLNNDLYHFTDDKAENFVFPYEDNSFDTIFLFSVFTHMQPLEVQNYFNEIQRVLKPGGKCLGTFFLYNDENEEAISSKKNKINFPYERENYRLMNEKVPSANIAFDEKYIDKMIKIADLKLENKIYGNWSKRTCEGLFDFQDILVFKKE
ncbi:class I SAM-dependent methyltransferase [Flavobacterium flavigenum]|uniref:class I SAM-dependent methyltransferase n=1 Tax=Flavobacterium flavigenum TaxID=3003258 RepID=UPI0022ABDE5B|nr:class I SAM-dependent methyltransferase [Flavobacterium flavigenum]